jgi:hypothetical protein
VSSRSVVMNLARPFKGNDLLDSPAPRIGSRRASGQPEGLRDSSRWSQTTGKRDLFVGTLKGCQLLALEEAYGLAPFQGAGDQRDSFPVVSATTGYYLAALQAGQNPAPVNHICYYPH